MGPHSCRLRYPPAPRCRGHRTRGAGGDGARFFLDTEFVAPGRGHAISLVSVAIAAEDGREYYAEVRDADTSLASEWVVANVLPHLRGGDAIRNPSQMRTDVLAFVGAAPEFWGYYAAFDWVALCQLFGDMDNHPHGWPFLAYDLRQALDAAGLSHIKQPDDAPHNALSDAQWVRDTWIAHCGKDAT